MSDEQLKGLVSSCLKKKCYKTEQIAQEAINRIHKKRKVNLRIYFCKECLGYHLTSRVQEIL